MKKFILSAVMVILIVTYGLSNNKIMIKNLPPTVTHTVPQSGDKAVNPSLKTIRVTFSKPMQTKNMWSWCQISSDSFPVIDKKKIHYLKDQRTCVLPVKLESNKTYAIWINTGKINNFRDLENLPAVPYLLVFKTMDDKSLMTIANAEKKAISAAEKWLALIDNGKYTESWNSSSKYFRKVVNEKQLEQIISKIRKACGAVVSRKVISSQHRSSIPGAPPGKYVIIKFKSSFANKNSAVETVTPMLDKDGQWYVSGYYIK